MLARQSESAGATLILKNNSKNFVAGTIALTTSIRARRVAQANAIITAIYYAHVATRSSFAEL